MKKLTSVLILVLLAGLGYIYRDYLDNMIGILVRQYAPCRTILTYSIGAFDERFDISREELKSALAEGEKIWETAAGTELFAYKDNGDLTINLSYDERQETTERLAGLGLVIETTRDAYNEVQAKYAEIYASYEKSKATFDRRVAVYTERKNTYESAVEYWNSRGGAPKAEYERLAAERDALKKEVLELKKAEARVNSLAADVNALVETLNKLADDLNLNARRYNTIGAAQDEEFEEGSYSSGPSGSTINIYQFDNRAKLVRVIAHEFGHALGIGHLEDPEAIMYRLNHGETGTPSKADIEALRARCSIKSE